MSVATVEKLDALPHHRIGGADIQPEQPFGGTAEGDAKLINSETAAQAVDIGRSAKIGIFLLDAFEQGARIKYADRVEIKALRFRDSEDAGASDFGNVLRHGIFKRDDGETFARREDGEKFIQILAGSGAAIEELICGVVFNFGKTGAAGAILLFKKRIEIPDAVYELSDTLRTAKIGGELKL